MKSVAIYDDVNTTYYHRFLLAFFGRERSAHSEHSSNILSSLLSMFDYLYVTTLCGKWF